MSKRTLRQRTNGRLKWEGRENGGGQPRTLMAPRATRYEGKADSHRYFKLRRKLRLLLPARSVGSLPLSETSLLLASPSYMFVIRSAAVLSGLLRLCRKFQLLCSVHNRGGLLYLAILRCLSTMPRSPPTSTASTSLPAYVHTMTRYPLKNMAVLW
jgi:hypothetical protein